MKPEANILIADDHQVVRQGLKDILHQVPEVATVYEIDTARGVIDFIRFHEVEMVILDLSLPDGNGLDLLKEIHVWKPRLPILIFSMYPEEQYALRVLKAGGSGYLTKGSSAETILTAFQKILNGGRYVSPSMIDQVAFELGGDKWKNLPWENLSDREHEVLRQITSGRTVSEIAKELHLSVKTVSTYRSRILEKTRLKTTADLIRFGLDNHFDGEAIRAR